MLILRTRFVTVADAQTYSYRGMGFRFGVTNLKCARVFFSAFFAAVQYSSVKFAIISHVFLQTAVPGRPWDRGRARRSDIFLARQNAWRPGDLMNPSENHT